MARKRREGAFVLSGIAQWLETQPAKKTQAAYEQWRKTRNRNLEPGQKPFLQAKGLQRQWAFPWSEIVAAIEEGRLPGETEKQADEDQAEAATSSAPARSHNFVLDQRLRARRLRSAREARGWSIKEVAEAASLDPSTLANLERAEVQQPAFESLVKLAEVLELQLNDFVSPD
jgi:DNA-binding Xre family transcriptional regulator